MDRFRITGPCRLEGTVRASGAKNAALPALAASLLTDRELLLDRLPDVRDIQSMRQLLAGLGIQSSTTSSGSVRLQAGSDLSTFEAPYDQVKKMRASILVLGPLVARRGRAKVSLPGGCAIGVRPIDQHIAGLQALGAEVVLEHGYVLAHAPRLQGDRFRFSVPTVTGTENLMMAATASLEGTNLASRTARCEPEIEDLGRTPRDAMGAEIEGAGSRSGFEIQGVVEPRCRRAPSGRSRIASKAARILIGAAITGGDVHTPENATRVEGLEPLLIELLGADRMREVEQLAVGLDPRSPPATGCEAHDMETAPHPGFPTDLQAQYMALA